MINDADLLNQFTRHMSGFYETTNTMRDEFYRSYEYRDGNQWNHPNGPNTKDRRNRTITTINLAAPIVRAVAGSEIMKANELDYISTDPEFDAEADIISDVVDWCQYASNYFSERAIASEDAATCGIGATVTYLDMTQKDFIAGMPVVERIFPGFLAFDNSSRGSQLNVKATWCAYADPVSVEWLDGYIAENKPKNNAFGAGDYKDFILSYARLDNYEKIDFLYHYFWYDFVDIYDVENPFVDETPLAKAVVDNPDIANTIGDMAAQLKIDWQASYWTLDKEQYKELTDTMELIQLMFPELQIEEPEHSKRKTKCYYRAEFARGMLLKKSKSYTQSGHPLNFITGYYEESTGNYYGMMRPLSMVQDNINVLVSDFMAYSKAASHGGSAWVAGAGEAFERIQKARGYEDDLTPIPINATITPKALSDTPQVLLQGITLMTELLPRVLGLGQEFLGVITSGDMTESLFGRVMKQSYAVLEAWKNNGANYDIRQGRVFEELSRMMAEAEDGRIIPVLSADNEPQAWTRLSLQSLARNYSIRIIKRKMSEDERQETFNKLSQLAPQAMQAGVNLFPMLAKYAPLDYSDRKEMQQLASPPPPPQPDPLNIATIEATNAYTNASAKKADADAQKTLADVDRMRADAELDRLTKETDIEKTITAAALDRARAQEALDKVTSEAVNRMLSIESSINERLKQSEGNLI